MRQSGYCTETILETLTDSELVRLAREGSSRAFDQLVLRYENKMYRLARRMTDTHEDAEDVLQEAFMRAFKAISSFEGKSRFSTWLYRITFNLALMKLRSRQVMVESLDAPVVTEDGEIRRDIRDEHWDPLDLLLIKESSDILDRAVEGLSPANRAVFVLRHVEGCSTEETAHMLNMSLAAVKSRLHRTRLTLQEQLSKLACTEAMAASIS